MNTHQISTVEALQLLGFDVKLQWHAGRNWLQITDANAVTFYTEKSATLNDCLTRYQQKQDEFKAAETMVKQNEL